MSSYLVPAAIAEAELSDRGSRFYARLEPVATEAEAQARLAALVEGHRDATHCCFAWRVGSPPRERMSDAGEPRGTAGPPILAALARAELSDALLVVVRWYGGTNLGKGGLVRAYGGVARAAVAAARVERRVARVVVTLAVGHEQIGALRRLLHPLLATGEAELVEESWGERVALTLRLAEDRLAAIRELAARLGAELATS
jgi:uncharacterized YigZ family protein